jgi:hypothetical protein
MKFNYGYILVDKTIKEDGTRGVYHFCGYESKPTFRDYAALEEELKNDPEFGWGSELDGFELIEASQEILDYHNEIFEREIKPQLKDRK